MSWQPKSARPPEGYRYGSSYAPSWENRLRALLYIALGKPRSLARDALLAMTNMPAPPSVRGAEHIPARGPFVVVANHYERPGLWMAWPALLVSHAVQERCGQDTCWIAIQEWESLRLWGVDVPPAATRAVFERAFHTYGILGMPPPYAEASARAAAMRKATGMVRSGSIIGVMPEGDVGATPELLPAKEGAGAFLLLLAAAGAGILPVGLFEEDSRLVARFGAPFLLKPGKEVARADRDRWASEQTMRAIRDLLPEPLWGVYRRERD